MREKINKILDKIASFFMCGISILVIIVWLIYDFAIKPEIEDIQKQKVNQIQETFDSIPTYEDIVKIYSENIK